jgi:hypothetical protein
MDWTLEVVILPVSGIDRAVECYRDKVGFDLDHDTRSNTWAVQELKVRGEKPLIPLEHRGRFGAPTE